MLSSIQQYFCKLHAKVQEWGEYTYILKPVFHLVNYRLYIYWVYHDRE